MIKRIQLRGISRTPSDRGTADGGCDESVNVHLDEQETAPTIPATEISDDIYRTATLKYPIMFIHKMTGITNYIGCSGVYLRAYGSTLDATGETLGESLGTGETFKHATSVGNTLIIFSDVKPYYFLFKEGNYNFLGNNIPAPAIEVISAPYIPISGGGFVVDGITIPGSLMTFQSPELFEQVWTNAINGNELYSDVLAFMDNVWGKVSLKTAELRRDGYFTAPFFLRYGLRMYNGQYIHVSVPILCQCRNENYNKSPWVRLLLGNTSTTQGLINLEAVCILTGVFQVCVKMSTYNASSWSDIVKSIDFFASTPIYAPHYETGLSGMEHQTGATGAVLTFKGMENDNREKTIRDEVISKGQFYKIASYELGSPVDIANLTSGMEKIENSDDISGDLLLTHEDLDEGYRTSSQYLPVNGAMNINSRVLLAGANEILPTGYQFVNGLTYPIKNSYNQNEYAYRFQYKINGGTVGTSVYVQSRSRTGIYRIDTGAIVGHDGADRIEWTRQLFGRESYTPSTGEYIGYAEPFSWIAFPDTRCDRVDIYKYEYNDSQDEWVWIGKKSIGMEPHPYIDCAYAFLGLTTPLDANMTPASGEPTFEPENRILPATNKVMLSELENPFIFPAGGIVTFSDDVVGAAMTSVPLSEGQMGQFDLYIFTNGGIRTLSLASDGTIVRNTVIPNLSQHIALPGTITALDQSVVFTTKRGVMLLQGHQVTELSANMIGKPFVLDNDMTALLGESEWASVMDAIPNSASTDIETFMEFVSAAKPAYDSAGRRIIFFRPQRNYQYVYMLNTATWHKVYQNVTPYKVLNSYPDCLIAQYHASGLLAGARVYNFSTILDDSTLFIPGVTDTRTPVKAIIVTRPFDLGEPDIRKAIKSLRIRGVYKNEMSGTTVTRGVRYILQASYDGLTWRRVQSLRGGSYKMFRLVLLALLMPEERISWIDIDYDTRFANRLR